MREQEEDALTKIVRLIANISTEEEFAQKKLLKYKDQTNKFIESISYSIES